MNDSHPQKLSAFQQKIARLGDVHSANSVQQLDAKALKLEVIQLVAHARLQRSHLFISGPARDLCLNERTQTLDKLLRKHAYANLECVLALSLVCFKFRTLLRHRLGAPL